MTSELIHMGGGGHVVHLEEFTPAYSMTTTPPAFEMPTVADPSYGQAPFGVSADDGTTVEEWGRVVTGSAFDDQGIFDHGTGFLYVPLQVAPHALMTGGVGEGQVVVTDGDGSALSTVTWEIDPNLNTVFGVEGPALWGFLQGVDWDAGLAAMVLSATNPGTPTTRFICAWHARYLKA